MRILSALAVCSLMIGACSLSIDPKVDAGPRDAAAPQEKDAGDPGGDGLDANQLDATYHDASVVDVASLDAGPLDAETIDAGRPGDAGSGDAGLDDSGIRDGGPDDAGIMDAGPPDASTDDAGVEDAAIRDANEADAGLTDAGPTDGGPGDAGPEDAGVSCPAGLTQCAEQQCVSTAFDPAHCGACGVVCEAGEGASAACLFGACVSACPAGLTLCGNDCVDIQKSSTHCGGCNAACNAPAGGFTTCEAGQCLSSCLSTDALCEGICIPVNADPNNCGSCSQICEAPLGGSVACVDFACVQTCPEPETLCHGECVVVGERSDHCGACDVECDSDTHCVDGECVRNPPVLASVTPNQAHVQAQNILTLTGERLDAPVSVWLRGDSAETELTKVFTSETRLFVRLPPGLEAGRYALRVETPSGESVMDDALEMLEAPLRIEVLEAGQGDAQIITGPDGTTMVIDGSIEPVGIQSLRPRFESAPDYVVVSHYDADHLGGIYALLAGPDLEPNTSDDVDPAIALLDHGDNHSCSSQLCANYLTLRDRLESIGKARTLKAGDVFSLGAGVTATCVLVNGRIAERPRQLTAHENENSVGMYIEFLGFSYLTAGDVTGGPIPGCSAAIAGDFVDVETPLARLSGRIDLLKVAHHGSCTATPLAFSALVQPQAGIISMGQNNAFCHPADRVTQNLFNLGTDLYLTTPAVDDVNNASGCPLSTMPANVAPFFSDVTVNVPGDGTFSVHVGEKDKEVEGDDTANQGESQTNLDAGPIDVAADASSPSQDAGPPPPVSSYEKNYASLRTRAVFQQVDFDNGYSARFEFLGDPLAQPVDSPIRIRTDLGWLGNDVFLIPLAKVSTELVQDLENGQSSADAISVTQAIQNEILELSPLAPLVPHTQYAILLLPTSTGLEKSEWLHFTTSLLLPHGASYSLSPPPAALNGILIDTPEIHLDFDRAVFNTESQGANINLFLEEIENSTETVTGTHTISEDGKRITLTLQTAPRTGPNGEACQSLCPNTTYAIRALGTIADSNGTPIDTDTLHTLTTADCADTSTPTLGRTEIRTFPNAASISLFTDEPVEGEVLIAPTAVFNTACATPIGEECIRVPLAQGACSGDPCAPADSSCHHFAVSEILDSNTDYTWEIRAADRIGKSLVVPSASLSTSTPSATLVFSEVYVDSQQSPESLGEYIEIVNVSAIPIRPCTYRVGKDPGASALKPLCSDEEALLAPFETALVTGNNFCAGKDGSCTSEFDLPSQTQIFRQSTASLLGGLSNGAPPDLYLVNENDEVVSEVVDAPACSEGNSITRLSLFGPDDPIMFECGPASPGHLEE